MYILNVQKIDKKTLQFGENVPFITTAQMNETTFYTPFFCLPFIVYYEKVIISLITVIFYLKCIEFRRKYYILHTELVYIIEVFIDTLIVPLPRFTHIHKFTVMRSNVCCLF